MKIKKKFYSWSDVEKMCVSIVNDMYADYWRPDYIVGITRGGNIPATIISNMTGIRCEAIKVSLRDNESGRAGDSVDWMSDDAFGILDGKIATGSPTSKKILIVDDINDTGATFNWIKKDWESRHKDPEKWARTWGHNVKFAVLTENLASEFDGVTYSCDEVNKAEEDCWLVYPWENVGEYGG
jgi:hypoxanthine phosphoribosyltransferase